MRAQQTSNCVSNSGEGQHQAFEISTSRKQGVLLYIILGSISLGALGGFGAFYLVFQYRYAALLLLSEGRHISTLDAFQARQEQVSKEHQNCLAREENQLVELAKARGRLEALGDLANNHRSLRDQHQESRDYIVYLESIREDSLSRVHQLESDMGEREDQVNELRKEMEGNVHHEKEKLSDQTDKVRGLMTRRTELMSQAMVLSNAKKELEAKLVEKKDEMKTLKRKEWDCRASYKLMERSHNMMERQTQQRQDFLCKEEYGNGPYYVQFALSFQGETAGSASSFVVELSSRKELPHSVFTFLTLVEYSLYHGTAFVAVNNNNTTDDHESTTSMSIGAEQPDSLSSAAVALDQKFRALGFGNTALSFLEESLDAFPCGQHSVGFDGLGPTIEIFLSDNNVSGRTCFGKIVRGMHTLSRVEAAVLEGQVVDIVKVQHLVM